MTPLSTSSVVWASRGEPLTPIAVAATGASAQHLAQRLLLFSDHDLPKFQAVAGDHLILVLGPTDILPWVDSVTYLGYTSDCPQLLSPTTLAPNHPLPLIDSALRQRLSLKGKLAILPTHQLVIPIESARPLSRDPLLVWLQSERHAAS